MSGIKYHLYCSNSRCIKYYVDVFLVAGLRLWTLASPIMHLKVYNVPVFCFLYLSFLFLIYLCRLTFLIQFPRQTFDALSEFSNDEDVFVVHFAPCLAFYRLLLLCDHLSIISLTCLSLNFDKAQFRSFSMQAKVLRLSGDLWFIRSSRPIHPPIHACFFTVRLESRSW